MAEADDETKFSTVLGREDDDCHRRRSSCGGHFRTTDGIARCDADAL